MAKLQLKVLVPVDFTEASEVAIKQAMLMKEEFELQVDLFHVVHELIESVEAESRLQFYVKDLRDAGIASNIVIEEGRVLPAINATCANGNYGLMILGTHGPRGLRQLLLGSDILHLLKENPCPSVVVQKKSTPVDHFRRILLPVGSHDEYLELVQATGIIAKSSQSEVIIYLIQRPGEDLAEELLENKEITIRMFKEHGVHYREVTEDMSVFSFGFAKQTLMYAEKNEVDLIAMMPHASNEHSYFADADKERIIMNDKGIAVLCGAGV